MHKPRLSRLELFPPGTGVRKATEDDIERSFSIELLEPTERHSQGRMLSEAPGGAIKALPTSGGLMRVRKILISLLMIEVTLVGAVVGLVSFFAARDSVSEITMKVHDQVEARIHHAIDDYFLQPSLLLGVHDHNVKVGRISPADDYDDTFLALWAQMASVSKQIGFAPNSIYAGLPNGDFVGVGFDNGGAMVKWLRDASTSGNLTKIPLDGHVPRVKDATDLGAYNATARPWYTKGDSIYWSETYFYADTRQLGITVSLAMKDATNTSISVFGVDLSLSHASDFLASIDSSDNSASYIVDKEGLMIAASEGNVTQGVDGDERKSVVDMGGIISSSYDAIISETGSLSNPGYMSGFADGYFIELSLVHETLHWYGVVASPADDYLHNVYQNGWITFAACLGFLVFAVVTGTALAGFVTRPLKRLSRELKYQNKYSMDSPATKIMNTLINMKQLAQEHMFAEEDVMDLEFAIRNFARAGNTVWAPQMNHQMNNIDEETSEWLKSVIASKEGRSDSALVPASKRRSRKHKSEMSSQPEAGVDLIEQSLKARLAEQHRKHLVEILEDMTVWNFKIFDAAELTHGQPLYYIGYNLIKQFDVISHLRIDGDKLQNYIKAIEKGYKNENPYHNSTHAADVAQTMFWFLTRETVFDNLTDMDVLIALMSAIIHDFEHDGRTNNFHVATSHPLAILYNDKSVLENHHVCAAYQLLDDEELNPWVNLSPSQRRELREGMIQLVLATDISCHFETIGKFKARLAADFDITAKEDRRMLLSVFLKCSDVSNPAKAPKIYNAWTDRVMEEFYQQGDEERSLGLPISPFMDRENPTLAQCQKGFIDFIVKPLYEVVGKVLPDAADCLDQLSVNRDAWEDQQPNSTAAE